MKDPGRPSPSRSAAVEALPVPPAIPAGEEPSTGALAYVGDAVYTLLVRSLVVSRGPAKQRELHARSVEAVRAAAQARSLERLEPYLTGDERAIVRRARNSRIGRGGGGTSAERHQATALEALFGYLYLGGRLSRLDRLFGILTSSDESIPGGEDSERHTPQAYA